MSCSCLPTLDGERNPFPASSSTEKKIHKMHLSRRRDGQLLLHSRQEEEDVPLLPSLGKRQPRESDSNLAVAVGSLFLSTISTTHSRRQLIANRLATYQIASVVAGIIACIFIAYIILRMLRSNGYEPKYVPTQCLKRKWKNWQPRRTYNQVPRETRHSGQGRDSDTAYRGPMDQATGGHDEEHDLGGGDDSGDAGVNRNTSVRSVMTLPAYSADPKASERIIGREGERAGMDMVVEFPETAEEEEMRREEQMESLYQIRLARRVEQEAREERRRQRREARNRSDWDRLNELRRERRDRARSEASQQSGDGPGANISTSDAGRASAATLVAEHQSRGRDRRVAAVEYAEVGHVRHDGTRLRASSQESDSRPLLDAAASIGGASGGDSPFGPVTPSRSRGNSGASSVMSMSTANSDFEHLPSASNISNSSPLPQTRPSSHDITPRDSNDVADASIPPPPDYDDLQWGDAPAYERPAVGGEEEPQRSDIPAEPPQIQLPNLTVLPSIEIESATPGNTAPNTPASLSARDAEDQDGSDLPKQNTDATPVTTERQP